VRLEEQPIHVGKFDLKNCFCLISFFDNLDSWSSKLTMWNSHELSKLNKKPKWPISEIIISSRLRIVGSDLFLLYRSRREWVFRFRIGWASRPPRIRPLRPRRSRLRNPEFFRNSERSPSVSGPSGGSRGWSRPPPKTFLVWNFQTCLWSSHKSVLGEKKYLITETFRNLNSKFKLQSLFWFCNFESPRHLLS